MFKFKIPINNCFLNILETNTNKNFEQGTDLTYEGFMVHRFIKEA